MASGQEERNPQLYNGDNDHLALSLSPPNAAPPPPPPPPPSFITIGPVTEVSDESTFLPTLPAAGIIEIRNSLPSSSAAADPEAQPSRPRRRRNLSEEDKIITPPYPWSENQRATVRTMEYLLRNGITMISGDVLCKKCERRYQIEFNLEEKFGEISRFIAKNKHELHHRAPDKWMSPILLNCEFCNHEKCVKPVMAAKKRLINWLFLLLGQMLGCCSLDQLKYFCKHTRNHRTGAKDRVLFLAYLEICKQLDPSGPFGI